MIDQTATCAPFIYWGHAPNSQTRGLEMKAAMESRLNGIVDPYQRPPP